MARLSDIIEDFLKELIDENSDSELQIQRNELANKFSCAPSQINYVLTTRFTTDKGYYIESRRGGGGYIVIKRADYKLQDSLVDIINEKIGDSITYDGGILIIDGLYQRDLITEREMRLMKAVVNDRSLGNISDRNKVRADLLKSMIMVIFS
ncbi:MAG: CtsR family transcriptional regulator [Bacillota bacterium]|nr:CtsR family transcriptional regulator [Bacillota bacterium]